MKILFDECVPQRLGRLLPDHDVQTVQHAGWQGMKNGDLLKRASATFDVMVTVDRNLAFQQDVISLPMPVIVLRAHSNTWRDLEPLMGQVVVLLRRTPLEKTLHAIG